MLLWGGGITVTYSLVGGMRSVAFTDFLQFTALVIVLAIMANKIITMLGGVEQVFTQAYAQRPSHFDLGFFAKRLHWGVFALVANVICWGIFGGLLSLPNVQRMLMANNQAAAKQVFFSTAALLPVLYAIFSFIGLGALVLYPALPRVQVIPKLVASLFSGAAQGGGIGLLAVLMSTVDSFLHSAAVGLVADLLYPGGTSPAEEVKRLRAVQLASLGLGVFGIAIAATSSASLYLNYFSWVLFSFVAIPFLGGTLGLKAHPKDLWLAVGVALVAEISGLIFYYDYRADWWYGSYVHTVWFFALVANALTYFSSHYLRNSGFVWVDQKGAPAPPWRLTFAAFTHWLSSFLPTPANAKTFAKTTIFANQKGYTLAFFLCLNYLVPLFMSTRTC